MSFDIRCLTVMTASLLVSFHGSAGATVDESAFKQHCGACHSRAASVARSLEGGSVDERRTKLEEFLRSHHAGDPKLRAVIIEYLVRLSEQ